MVCFQKHSAKIAEYGFQILSPIGSAELTQVVQRRLKLNLWLENYYLRFEIYNFVEKCEH
jgi:hypothetical protein